MKTTIRSRLLAWLLVFTMVFGLVPTVAFAAEESATYTKIGAMDELVSGKYVMVVSSNYAPTVLDGTWVLAEAVTATDGTITDPAANLVWTLTVSTDGVILTDSNGTSIAPKGGNNNGISSGSYNWAVTCTDGTFRFAGTGSDTVILASNKGSANKFRGYKSATVTANAAGYPSDFTLYKLVEAAPQRESGLITDLTQLQDGDKLVIFNPANMKALSSTYTGFYNCGVDVTMTEGKLSGYTNAELWTLGVNENGSYTFSTAEGKKLSLGASYSSMPLDDVNVDWEISTAATADCFYIKNIVRGNYIEWYADKNNWSSYYNIGSNESLFAQQFYLVIEEDTEDPSEPADPEEFVPISTALAGNSGETFTVKGVITLLDGKNVYLQDATGGICVRMNSNFTDLNLGDTILGTGNKTVYNGLPQLGSGTYTKSQGLTLEARNTTIDALTTADICTYVRLTGLEITEVYDNNGAYSTPNITMKDDAGNTIQLYKAIIGKDDSGAWAYAVGDKVDVCAAVGCYNTTLQLRNTNASEVTPARQDGPITALSDLQDGDTVVIYNPAHMMALSSNYTGFYNSGTAVTVANGKLSGYTSADIWTVGINADGSYTLSTAEGKKLSLGASHSSMPLDDVNVDWTISPAATSGCFYIKNVARGNYIEWYADKNNWSSYYNIGSNESLFAQTIYLVTAPATTPETGLPNEGDMVMLYNLSAQGVLALQDGDGTDPTACAINNAPATVENGAAVAENGGLVFKVEKNGDYYRFFNETFGYLCSTGTGNNAFYSLQASEDADWTLTSGKSGGYNMESRTAKFNGQYSQYLEYYADSYKTYSMYNVTDYDIYAFFFYPCGNQKLTSGVVNDPKVTMVSEPTAFVGADYVFKFTVDTVFGMAGKMPTVTAGNNALTDVTMDLGIYAVTVPAQLIGEAGEKLTLSVSGEDIMGVSIYGSFDLAIKDEPVIGEVTPAPGSQTGENLRPTVSAVISNCGENATFTMTINDQTVNAVFADGQLSYTPAEDLAQGRTTVVVTVTRADGKQAEKTWSFTAGKAQYSLYFGQLHSHTTYSDGSGSLETALGYIENLPESANVDFVAFTDHSNYFDTSSAANPEGALYDMSLASTNSQALWSTYTGAISDFNARNTGRLALAGFEMTWSGGPGHINTFNTPGIVSRNNSTLNSKTQDAGMKAYYALLSQPEGAESISQFNHPGSTFGTFTDFSYWDALIDTRIQLVEVGNGEGQIGAGGYYPSYEYYTMALDKGWHVAPTNNQDNHKGKWGNANDARDVVLTDDFSPAGIYEAIRNYRVYATEDKNLEINYTVNGLVLGSVLAEAPESLNLNVQLFDPDVSDSISKVEVIVNSGKVAYTWDNAAELALGELNCTLSPDYSYYYIRVTQGDGDLAVTAPVWVGETLKLGISSVECGTATPVTGEELTITTTLFNSETTPATVKSVTYMTNGSQVLGTDTTGYTVPASGTLPLSWNYTPDTARVMTITVYVVMELEGIEYEFSMDVELDVLDADALVYIGIDASHFNEYVNGNYKDSMGNFSALAAQYSVRTVILQTGEELIAAANNKDGKYKAIILTAPSRRNGTALRDPYVNYTDAEIQALVDFNKAGGAVILAGWSDYYEHYSAFPEADHMAAQQNQVLAALGSSLRIADDGTNDDTYNGGQSQRLYLNTYNWDNFLTAGVEYDAQNPHDNMYSQQFSHYGGASIYAVDANGQPTATLPATVSPVVYGHATTYSKDADSVGVDGDEVPKYEVAENDSRLMLMGTEQLPGQGLIVVSGAAFMSNFEVQATVEDSGAEKNYSNYNICENLVAFLNPARITPIAEVRAQTQVGYKYTIEGVVTSNASGYDKATAFFDCIYVQDATGGICCFPVAGNYRIGDEVRITGTTEFYQGEPELQVTTIEKIGTSELIQPETITAAQLTDRSAEGKLVTLKGTVESFELANGLVQTIMVKDEQGNVARVFIDGYITTDKDVENLAVGHGIAVTGLASYDDTFNAPEGPFPRIRVRNRADVICTPVHTHQWGNWTETTPATCLTEGLKVRACTCGETEEEVIPALGHDLVKTVVAPTCTALGYTEHRCSRCDYNYISDMTAAKGHSYTSAVTQPTCTAAGFTTHTCETCGDTYVDSIVEAKGHNYASVVTAPTHDKMGYTTHTCTACGHSYVDTYTDALGHEYTYAVTKAPTCTTEGEMTFTCTCGKSYTETIPMAEHKYAAAVTEPTCTTMGYTTHTCEDCGNSYKDSYVDAKGHDCTVTVVEPSCEGVGYSLNQCKSCNHSYITNLLAPKGHSYQAVVTEPTCTAMGYTTYTCEVCKDSYIGNMTQPAGHHYNAVVTAPTCIAAGYTTHTCNACGDTYVDTIVAAKGHDYESVVTEPTHDKMGYTTHTCTACGHRYVDTYTDALEHNYTSAITNAPTCTTEGVMTFTCSCGKSYTEVIPMTEHSYTAAVTEPTCTTMGYTTHTCTECRKSYKDSYVDAKGHNCIKVTVPAGCTEYGYTSEKCQKCDYENITAITQPTGHTWSQWSVLKAPTCTETGLNQRACSGCHANEYETVAALGHRYTSKVVEPTCTEVGYTVHTCECGHSYITDIVNTVSHSYKSVVTAPTHTEMGYTTHTCTVCGHCYVDSYTAALDHEYTREVTKAPTCTEEGEMTFTCSCGESYTEVIPMTGHEYAVTVVEPTCEGYGYTRHACKHCDYSYISQIADPLGHSLELTNEEAPTCEDEGYTGDLICTVCGHVEEEGEVIPATGHTWSQWVITEEPDCFHEGQQERSCTVCQKTETEAIPANGDHCPSQRFTDLDAQAWYHEGIDFVLDRGYMRGISETEFAPNGTLTRGQLVTILYRMAGSPEAEGGNVFTDVAENTWYTEAVIWAQANGITKGISDTLFAPNQPVTREQMVTFIARFARYQGMDTTATGDLSAFSDKDAVSGYAVDAMIWATQAGLISGMGDGTLAPRATANRAQVAKIVMVLSGILEG